MKRDNKKETTCWDKTEIEKFSYSSKTFLNVDFCPKNLVFVSSQQLVVHLNQRVVFAWLLQYSCDKCDRFFTRGHMWRVLSDKWEVLIDIFRWPMTCDMWLMRWCCNIHETNVTGFIWQVGWCGASIIRWWFYMKVTHVTGFIWQLIGAYK